MPTILKYIEYFVDHLKELLIDHCNPILRARYFGVLFDKMPSYAEIDCRTPENEKVPEVNELFKLVLSGTSSLVRLIDSQWHRVLPSITTMYNKLIDLGFTYYNGEVHIVEPEDNENAKK